MKLRITIMPDGGKAAVRSDKQIGKDVETAAELWSAGKKEEAAAIIAECFQYRDVPSAESFIPYIKKLGEEYCSLIEKLYLSRCENDDDDTRWGLLEFLEACPAGTLTNSLAARIVGEKWDCVQEKFYEKCPECMFMGEADEPYSLKIRSPRVVECIPEGADLHELAGMEYMDGYNRYEGFALVKDDPKAKVKYPEKIQAILKKIEGRGREHFPNLIFPLTEGENILDSCIQMQEALDLLDYGYHFENISAYISEHPELFKDKMKRRKSLLQALADEQESDDTEEDDDELNIDDFDFLFEDDEEEEDVEEEEKKKEKSPKSSGKKGSRKKK